MKELAIGEHRPFSITLGLEKGYNTNIFNSINDVIDIHHEWQETKQIIFGVLISPTHICYGYKENNKVFSAQEPGCIIHGEVNILYMKDENIWEILKDLSSYLAEKLNQKRIYITFMNESVILES